MSLESPPLWVWAIIAGIIVAGKLTYRWYATKRLAKDLMNRSAQNQSMYTVTLVSIVDCENQNTNPPL